MSIVKRRRRNERMTLDIETMKRLYLEGMLSSEEIGRRLGCNTSTVLRHLRWAGVSIRHHNDTKRGKPARNRAKLNTDAVVAMFENPKESAASVARAFSVDRRAIVRILTELRIPIERPLRVTRENGGQLNPRWRADLSPEERVRRRDMHRQAQWRVKVYERDGYICQRCRFDKGGKLNAHHIESHSAHAALRWDVANGITLCVPCHRAFHREYGYRGGTAELQLWLSAYSVGLAA